jgi:hypothetical protein
MQMGYCTFEIPCQPWFSNHQNKTDLAEDLVPLAIESKLFEYLNDSSSPANSPGYVWRTSNDGWIAMQCQEIVSWDLEQKWIAEFYGSYNYHHSLHKNGKSTYPNASYICNLPIAVDGLYLDQCACGLSILGIPFFYCYSQELMLGEDFCATRV